MQQHPPRLRLSSNALARESLRGSLSPDWGAYSASLLKGFGRRNRLSAFSQDVQLALDAKAPLVLRENPVGNWTFRRRCSVESGFNRAPEKIPVFRRCLARKHVRTFRHEQARPQSLNGLLRIDDRMFQGCRDHEKPHVSQSVRSALLKAEAAVHRLTPVNFWQSGHSVGEGQGRRRISVAANELQQFGRRE